MKKKRRRRIFYLSHTQYNQQWNVFSAFNPSKCTHTWSSGQPTAAAPGEQLEVQCLAQGSHLGRGQFLPEPRFEPTTSGLQVQCSIPLGHWLYTVSYCHTHMLYIIMFYLNLFDIFFWLFLYLFKKRPSNTSFPYSFSFLSTILFIFIYIKTLLRHTALAALTYIYVSIVLICKSLWTKMSAEWLNVNVYLKVYFCHIKLVV